MAESYCLKSGLGFLKERVKKGGRCEKWSGFAILKSFGGSSNGRTAAFGAVNLGSIPSPPVVVSAV